MQIHFRREKNVKYKNVSVFNSSSINRLSFTLHKIVLYVSPYVNHKIKYSKETI